MWNYLKFVSWVGLIIPSSATHASTLNVLSVNCAGPGTISGKLNISSPLKISGTLVLDRKAQYSITPSLLTVVIKDKMRIYSKKISVEGSFFMTGLDGSDNTVAGVAELRNLENKSAFQLVFERGGTEREIRPFGDEERFLTRCQGIRYPLVVGKVKSRL